MWFQSLGQEDPLEEEMATHPSILAWRIPWTEESRGLQSIQSQRIRTLLKQLSTHTQYSTVCIHHIFFVHLSVDGHLSCFLVLVIVNNAALKVGVQIYI